MIIMGEAMWEGMLRVGALLACGREGSIGNLCTFCSILLGTYNCSQKKKKKSTIIVVILYHSVNILKSTDVYTLKGGIRCYMN